MDYQLELIRKYSNTKGRRLKDDEKNLLCKILENPKKYSGFVSKLYEEKVEDRDYRGSWTLTTNWQYRIDIDDVLSIVKRYRRKCDGLVLESYWDWENAQRITDIRDILTILKEIESEL